MKGTVLYDSREFMKDYNKEMVYFIDYTIITWAVLFVYHLINLHIITHGLRICKLCVYIAIGLRVDGDPEYPGKYLRQVEIF
jgi:hypothetical protein